MVIQTLKILQQMLEDSESVHDQALGITEINENIW